MSASWSMPAAVVAAGGLIGLGLFLGLSRPTEDPPVLAPADEDVRRETSSAVQTAPIVSPAPQGDEDLRAEARTRARAAVESIRETLVTECWQPSAAKTPEPRSVEVVLSLAFDAEGRMRGTGVVEKREGSRPDMSACLTERVHALSIDGLGRSVSLELALTLP